MKIVRFDRKGSVEYGILEGEVVYPVVGNIFSDFEVEKKPHNLSEVTLLPPVQPGLIVGIGTNYRDRAKESGMDIPLDPIVFFKPASCVIGPSESIVYPEESKELTYAGELGVVMKQRAVKVSEKDALKYVLGYTCANDLTAVDVFKKERMISARGKCFYTFCPIGPCIATDLNGNNLRLTSRLNGDVKQDAETGEMIFDISRIISFVSGFMVLEPGDVIITGSSRRDSTAIQVGDIIEIEVEGIGELRNRVIGNP
jgi:2-keto-4-pentenoate hydratase/2-oxohepta-3-ene-1,7-dioic acid hydratase in catechol pathway